MNSLKIIALGDGAVGKTTMLLSYTTNTFTDTYIPTVFDNYIANIVVDKEIYNLQLWDTAGQEDYDRIRPLCYASTDICLVCYSVINKTSFDNAIYKWKNELNANIPKTPLFLVGLKNDLRNTVENPVNEQEAYSLAKNYGFVDHRLCSAMTQDGLKELFEYAVKYAVENKNKKEEKKCVIL
jgi:small GTP-binding protein